MARKLSAISGQITPGRSAAIATAMAGATSAAEVTALRELLDVLYQRKDILMPALKLCSLATQTQLQPE